MTMKFSAKLFGCLLLTALLLVLTGAVIDNFCVKAY